MPDEAVVGPNGDEEPLAALAQCSEAFLSSVSPATAEFRAGIEAAAAVHHEAFRELRSALKDENPTPRGAIVAYGSSVCDDVVDPLRAALRDLDLPDSANRAWSDASDALGLRVDRLHRKDRLQVSPRALYLQAMARGVATVEAAIVHWNRQILDTAAVADERQTAGPGEPAAPPGSEDIEARATVQDFEPLLAAAGQLEESLRSTAVALDALHADVMQEAALAAADKVKQLGKALAAGDGAEVADEEETASSDLAEADRADEWDAWFRQVEGRLRLATGRWALFEASLEMQAQLIDGVGEEIASGWTAAERNASAALLSNRKEAEALFETLRETGGIRNAIRSLKVRLTEAAQALDTEFFVDFDAAMTAARIRERAEAAIATLRSSAEALPESVSVHATPDPAAATINPAVASLDIEVRGTALRAIEQSLAPAAQGWTKEVLERLRISIEETDHLLPVLRFHLAGAMEELSDVAGNRVAPERRQNAESAAEELTLAGLDRALEVIAKLGDELRATIDAMAGTVGGARQVFWANLNNQLTAETAQAKLALQFESTAETAFKAVRANLLSGSREMLGTLAKHAVRLRDRSREFIRRSHAAIVGAADPVNYESTLNALASLGEIQGRLPPVYRRLFTFHPLADESLMVGRDEDMAWLQAHLHAHRNGRHAALVISGTPGSGISTFINAAGRTCLRRARIDRLDLPDRLDDEAELVERLCTTLQLEDAAGEVNTLSDLAGAILGGEPGSAVRVCVVDRFEHLLLRTIGGFDLAARMLRLMSATASRILWIATASDYAWQLMRKNEPLAPSLVTHYRLSEYDRMELEEVVIQRHRRSALPITFTPPAELSPLLNRRLRKAESEEERQAIYRSVYFDQLFAASGQNVMLAIFYWLLSVRYVADEPRIDVGPLPDLKFELLARLSVPEHFALKAFLEHATLTPEEYSQVTNSDQGSGFEVFQSLSNAVIIERAGDEDEDASIGEAGKIERDGRYRLRPLLVQPIIRSLRAKNIVH